MEQSFWQKLQRVKPGDIGHFFLFLLALPVALIYRLFRKDLWLICDNENEARDNGYWLFRYITEKHPEQDVMYAINKKSPDYARVKNLGPVVQYGSFMHWVYYLTAAKNISSQKGGKPNAAICYVLEVYGILRNQRIFLQHGITKDDMEFLYYKHTKMRMFICAVDREYEYVKERFGYPDGWVVNTGFCRFDNLFDTSSECKKQILVMPTWRNWIGAPTDKSYQLENIEHFADTEYFKYWQAFLSDDRLKRILEKENITLVFYPHREMQKFIKYFALDNERMKIAAWPEYDVQELLKESHMLITDYSSIAMDFAYMKKPLFYYQFDYEKFRRGHYAEGYFSYENDGFGPICQNEKQVEEYIEKCVAQNWTMEEEYKKRVEKFFTRRDDCNCERNYKVIQNIGGKGKR